MTDTTSDRRTRDVEAEREYQLQLLPALARAEAVQVQIQRRHRAIRILMILMLLVDLTIAYLIDRFLLPDVAHRLWYYAVAATIIAFVAASFAYYEYLKIEEDRYEIVELTSVVREVSPILYHRGGFSQFDFTRIRIRLSKLPFAESD